MSGGRPTVDAVWEALRSPEWGWLLKHVEPWVQDELYENLKEAIEENEHR